MMTVTQEAVSETTADLNNTDARLSELREKQAMQSAEVDQLSAQYVGGNLAIDKLQSAQTKLASLDDLIKNLAAKREGAANKLAIARRAHDAEQQLSELDAIDTAAADALRRYRERYAQIDDYLSKEMPALLEIYAQSTETARSFSDAITREHE